jgi:hypothetical protein
MLEKIVKSQVSESGCTVCTFNTSRYSEAVWEFNTKWKKVKGQREGLIAEKKRLNERIAYVTKKLNQKDNQSQKPPSL